MKRNTKIKPHGGALRMKNRIKRKLTSTDGISVLFGLLFFLVAAILSAVMISASVTAIKSVTSDYKTEQNYQTCAGAAAIIRDAITDTTVTETIETTTKSGKTTSEDPSWSVTVKKNNNAKNFSEKYLKGWMQSLIESSTNSEEAVHDISISGIEGLENVNCKVSIKRDDKNQQTLNGTTYSSYDINVVFTTGTGVDECILTLTLSGQLNADNKYSSTGGKTTITTVNYYWDSPVIVYGDKSEEAGS
jgi:type II secretory pathway pseudopilin PulG